MHFFQPLRVVSSMDPKAVGLNAHLVEYGPELVTKINLAILSLLPRKTAIAVLCALSEHPLAPEQRGRVTAKFEPLDETKDLAHPPLSLFVKQRT
jgi:hypothetical protein